VVPRERKNIDTQNGNRPSTVGVIDYSQPIAIEVTVTRPMRSQSQNGSVLHPNEWDNSTKVKKHHNEYQPIPVSTPVKSLAEQNVNSVTPRSMKLIERNKAKDERGEELEPCNNTAVETAFTRAINHREVNSKRLRVGLLTNDLTPRVYLQVSRAQVYI